MTQFVEAADQAEEVRIRKILQLKDRIVKSIPAFRKDARETRRRLKRHHSGIHLPRSRGARTTSTARRRAEQDNRHNWSVASAFASIWNLPYPTDRPDIDPSYLFERPFSGAPFVGGTLGAVRERLGCRPPVLVFEVDVRYPKQMLMRRIDRRIREAQREWRRTGGAIAQRQATELETIEKMLKAEALSRRGTTPTQVRDALDLLSTRYVHKLRQELRRMRENRTYRRIAPYTDLLWDLPREAALSQEPWPSVSKPVV